MRHLDGASAMMIYSDMPSCYQHTLKIAVLDFSESEEGYQYSKVLERIRQGVESVPFLKWKIARVPFGLNHPYWVQDLDFDLSHHVLRIACPAPGDKQAFCKLVSELYAQRLDKSMALWTNWVVEGLEDDKVAVVAMLHHAYTDGAGIKMILDRMVSPDASSTMGSQALGVNPYKNPSRLRLLLKGAVDLPLMFLHTLPSLIRDWRKLKKLERAYKSEGRETPPNPALSPATPLLNAPYSHGRTFCYDSFDLAKFKAVAKRFDATINDLLLAVVSGAIRNWHLDAGLEVSQPLVSGIPINMRSDDQNQDLTGNNMILSSVSLPIHLNDAVERLAYVHKSALVMKDYVQATGGVGLIRAAELLPPFFSTLMNWVVRRSRGRFTPSGSLGVSNVAGPKEFLYVAPGVRVSDWLSIGQVTMGLGLNITAWSYVDRLNICLMANEAIISDGEQFLGYISRAFDEYMQLSERRQDTKKL